MKIKSIVLIPVLLPLLFAGCKQTSAVDINYAKNYMVGFKEGQESLKDWKVFTDDYSYYVLLPPSWTSTDNNAGVFIMNDDDSAYVVLSSDSGSKDIDEALNRELSFAKANSNYVLLSDNKERYLGMNARTIIYTWTDPYNTQTRYCRSMGVATPEGPRVLTFYVLQKQLNSYTDKVELIFSHYLPLR